MIFGGQNVACSKSSHPFSYPPRREMYNRMVAAEAEVERLKEALRSLWDVTIVGHREDGDCPYRVGHSPTEHVVFGHDVMSLEGWVAAAKPS